MKSHVSLEQHQCPICGKVHETGAVLLDKRLLPSMEPRTVTGLSPCPECAAMLKERVALIVVDNEHSKLRTGEVLWVKREAWPHVFDVAPPEGGIAMIGPDSLEKLIGRMPREDAQ